MMTNASAVVILLATTIGAMAQPLPIPRVQGQQCPAGYASGAHWCTPLPSTTRDAVAKPRGVACPSGWIESGGACLSPPRRRQ
jgi:hypothetical protein